MLSSEERRAKEDGVKAEKTVRLEASNTRKREMQELEVRRKKSEKPSDLEQVGHTSDTYQFVQPSWDLKMSKIMLLF